MITFQTSTRMLWADYDSPSSTLTIKFKSGQIHAYVGVPFNIYISLTTCPSPGKFFDSRIKGKFAEKK